MNYHVKELSRSSHGSEAGSYLRLIDSCITQLKAQGPSRTCNESREEGPHMVVVVDASRVALDVFRGQEQRSAPGL